VCLCPQREGASGSSKTTKHPPPPKKGAEASRLLRGFLALDTDYSGALDYAELAAAAAEAAPHLAPSELRAIFDALDTDATGAVDACEFFAAALTHSVPRYVADVVAERSFKRLDRLCVCVCVLVVVVGFYLCVCLRWRRVACVPLVSLNAFPSLPPAHTARRAAS
jgi:hypothetical protein